MGKSLNRTMSALFCREEKFPLDIGLYLVAEICRELAAHGSRREISPRNVVISYEGVVRILRASGGASHGELGGRSDYRAPEEGAGRSAGQRSDVFSVGLILFVLISGEPNFESGSGLPPRVDGLAVDDEVRRVLSRALERNPSDRYRSLVDLLDAVRNCLARRYPLMSRRRLAGFMRGVWAAEIGEELALVRHG